MSSFVSILGIGEISQSGSSVCNDSFGRSGELVMGTHQTNGNSAWQLTLHDLYFTPTSARVTRFEVQGYNVPHCAGHPPPYAPMPACLILEFLFLHQYLAPFQHRGISFLTEVFTTTVF